MCISVYPVCSIVGVSSHNAMNDKSLFRLNIMDVYGCELDFMSLVFLVTGVSSHWCF